jgi:hypothetical protein
MTTMKASGCAAAVSATRRCASSGGLRSISTTAYSLPLRRWTASASVCAASVVT